MNQIDLRTCKPGDQLISSLGAKLKYIGPTDKDHYYDHIVEYEDKDKGHGTRTHDGHVFRHNRKVESDHDIIKINPLN